VARELVHVLPARLALKSKSERGYELIDEELGAPVRAGPIDLTVCASTRDGFKMIGGACLKQVIDNERAIIKGDPEGVHQMRVGLRRLRAAMSLFSALLHDPQTSAIKTELKWLAGELAPAREIEVLMKRVVKPLEKKGDVRRNGLPALLRELVEKRKAALERVQNTIASTRFRALTLEVAAWLETRHWMKPEDDLVRSRGEVTIQGFAADQLGRRWRKVRKKGKALAQLDAPNRHKLRIQVKKPATRRSSSVIYLRVSRCRSAGRNSWRRLSICRMRSATSTTSRWTRTSSRQRASGGNARIPNAPSPPDC
jgi:triphosphatase